MLWFPVVPSKKMLVNTHTHAYTYLIATLTRMLPIPSLATI